MYVDLRVTYPLFMSNFIGTWIFSKFSKNPLAKFHENPPIRIRVVPIRTDGHDDL